MEEGIGGGCRLGNGEEPLLGVAIRGGKLGGLLGLAVTEDFFGTTVMVGVPVAAEGLTTVSTRTSPVEAGGTSRPRGPARSSTRWTAGTRRTSCWAGRQWSTWAGG